MSNKKGQITIYPLTKDERKLWELRFKSLTKGDAAESKQFYKMLRSKARANKAKFPSAKEKDIMILFFTMSCVRTPLFVINLEKPLAKDAAFKEDRLYDWEIKRWEKRLEGFKASELEEDVALIKQVEDFVKKHRKEDKTTPIKILRLWLFIVSYVQIGFWADDILKIHRIDKIKG